MTSVLVSEITSVSLSITFSIMSLLPSVAGETGPLLGREVTSSKFLACQQTESIFGTFGQHSIHSVANCVLYTSAKLCIIVGRLVQCVVCLVRCAVRGV